MIEHKDTPSEKRTMPMEVLCLGMCRTGTQSLANGLRVLGYGPIYHMREVKKSGHVESWAAALEAKFEKKGNPYGRKEFDILLGDWAGVTDIPAALFFEELMDAYPEAKMILTSRDEEKWFDSMKSTIWHAPYRSPVGTLIRRHVWGDDPERFGIQRYRAHNENVRNLAKAKGREILEYEVKQGYGPLCQFLKKDDPLVDFPRADDWAEYKKMVAEKLTEEAT